MDKTTKRKHSSKPIHEKYQALIEVEQGAKKCDIAKKYDVPANTLSTWIKNSEKIKTQFQSGQSSSSRKRIQIGKYDEVDSALFKWFSNKMSEGACISGPILMAKANLFAKDMGYTEFECTLSWLKRHEINMRKIEGEEKSVNLDIVDKWHQTVFQNILQDYEPNNIYNADETALFYKMLPTRTLAFKG